MVDIKALDAAGAYGKLIGQNQSNKSDAGSGFQTILSSAIGETKQGVGIAEKLSMAQVAGKGELIDVVTAMNNAEMVVESVVAVRDRVIQAYNDIIRMPM